MVLLNLIASLSLVAAVGVPAVVSSQSEIEESSVSYLDRKNASGFMDGYLYSCIDVSYDPVTTFAFDGVLPRVLELYFDDVSTYAQGYGVFVSNDTETFNVDCVLNGSSADLGFVPRMFIFDGEWHVADRIDYADNSPVSGLEVEGHGTLNLLDYYRVIISSQEVALDDLPDYLESKNIVPSITNGLGVVSNLASGLVGGFDSLALNDGALTNVMAFAFTFLGIGTAVGVAKLCFNWVTGRHGM